MSGRKTRGAGEAISNRAKPRDNLKADGQVRHFHLSRGRRTGSVFSLVNGPSLEEINQTVRIPDRNASFWRQLLAFSGPGALVAVGYMDPGNWVTSIGGGQRYGYVLLHVVLVSALVAMLLQYMAAKLGIVTGMDLAQVTRHFTSRRLGLVLWIINELAIMATDLAEVIGSAISLHLLFGIPLLAGVIITVFDVLSLLALMLIGFRKIEALVFTLILTIMAVFVYEVAIAPPQLVGGFLGHGAFYPDFASR